MRRWANEDKKDAAQQRLDNNPKISVMRRQTVEHPFNTIKIQMGRDTLFNETQKRYVYRDEPAYAS